MTRHEQPSALRPEILAARIYTALCVEDAKGTFGPSNGERMACWACDYAADFIAEWRKRDPLTAAPRFEGQDVPEARGLAVEVAGGR